MWRSLRRLGWGLPAKPPGRGCEMKKRTLDVLLSEKREWQEMWTMAIDLLTSAKQTRDGTLYQVALEFQRKMVRLSRVEVKDADS